MPVRTPTPEPGARPGTLVLIGFMAAGKTTVGKRLAERLGWRFIDVDARIVREQGAGIAELFATRGEATFREIERQHTTRWLTEQHVVLATGGGWAAQAGALDAVPATARSVWLRISVHEAVRRARASGTVRPLLEVDDPIAAATALLQKREPYYERADTRVDVDGREPDEIAAIIEYWWREI